MCVTDTRIRVYAIDRKRNTMNKQANHTYTLERKKKKTTNSQHWQSIYLILGTAAAACIGGGTLYGNGNFAATAGFSNNMFTVDILSMFLPFLLLIVKFTWISISLFVLSYFAVYKRFFFLGKYFLHYEFSVVGFIFTSLQRQEKTTNISVGFFSTFNMYILEMVWANMQH